MLPSSPLRAARPTLLLALLASLGATARAHELRVVDLSESGTALVAAADAPRSGAPLGSEANPIAIAPGPTSAWDVLDFEVRGATAGVPVHVRIDPAFDLEPGFVPTVSEGEFRWRAVEGLRRGGGLRFFVTPSRERFLVRLKPRDMGQDAAYYPWSRFVSYMASLAGEPRAAITQVGSSIQGRPLYRILVDDPTFPGPKKTVLVVVRQHGDEWGSSYLLEGFLDLLLDRHPGGTPGTLERVAGTGLRTRKLRRVRWIIYPLMNPDGAVMERRYNANGVDLNRDWDRNGANEGQEPETLAIQSDVEALDALYDITIGGDHHGWTYGNHGGFRYAPMTLPSNTTLPEYEEARKDTQVITRHDSSQWNWIENGGTVGMLRVEMFLRLDFLLHTPEYDSNFSSIRHFLAKGEKWGKSMVDTLFAPRFTDAAGEALTTTRLGQGLFVTADDFDEDVSAEPIDTIEVVVFDPASGDVETLTLAELAVGGFFRNESALPTATGPASVGNGVLETSSGATVRVRYTDDDYPRDESFASVRVR